MPDSIRESSLEQVVPEQDFVPLVSHAGVGFFGVAADLLSLESKPWSKRRLFLLQTEADELESFLDDYGARFNRTYGPLTELIASVRGFALAGLSLEHLVKRIEGYGVLERVADPAAAQEDLVAARTYVQGVLVDLLRAAAEEARRLGIEAPNGAGGESDGAPAAVRFRLAGDVDLESIEDEAQRIAEVSSKYLQACQMLKEAGFEPLADSRERGRFLRQRCSEERARVYEATVHNLQSAYDTFIKNTVVESQDPRLAQMRGHVSASLHLLEAATQLIHFVERHGSDPRPGAARPGPAELAPRDEVHHVTLNLLLVWADRMLQAGRGLAEELLPSYTNLLALEVQLREGLSLHARPASLIVSIVNHHGTPVEMEVAGRTCNAGSILELMVLVGSNPEADLFCFRGDEHPLRDIGLLFEHGLGEHGVSSLPDDLGYLHRS
jgi:phosphotransferase system HPr (HPr) family protein